MNSDSQRDDTKIGAVMLEADMGELPTPKISTLVLRLLAMQKKKSNFYPIKRDKTTQMSLQKNAKNKCKNV